MWTTGIRRSSFAVGPNGRNGAAARDSSKTLLLRDTEDPQRFVSFGPWESVAAIAGWRALPGYQERVDRLRQVVDGFEPRTLEVVARR